MDSILDIISLPLEADKICRACLAMDETLTSIYDAKGNNIIADMYESITRISIEMLDGLPSLVCQRCIDDIYSSYMFQMKCANSDSALRKLFNQSDVNLNDMEVKEQTENHQFTDENVSHQQTNSRNDFPIKILENNLIINETRLSEDQIKSIEDFNSHNIINLVDEEERNVGVSKTRKSSLEKTKVQLKQSTVQQMKVEPVPVVPTLLISSKDLVLHINEINGNGNEKKITIENSKPINTKKEDHLLEKHSSSSKCCPHCECTFSTKTISRHIAQCTKKRSVKKQKLSEPKDTNQDPLKT